MTSGEPSGPSAAKFGGYTLIGVGALAAVVGVTTAFTGGTQNNAEGPVADPPSSSAPSPDQPAPLHPEQLGGSGQSGEAGQPGQSDGSSQLGNGGRPGESGQADGSDRAGQPGQPAGPGDPGQQDQGSGAVPGGQESGGNGQGQVAPGDRPGAPDGSQQANSEVTVRVYNNSTVKGLAHRAAEDFRTAGYDVPQVGNYPSGKIPTTTVYFRPGTEEQAQAQQVADQFGARAEPRFEGLEPASPGVIALITDDYKGPQ